MPTGEQRKRKGFSRPGKVYAGRGSLLLPKVLADMILFAAAFFLASMIEQQGSGGIKVDGILLTLPFVVMLKVASFALVGSYASLWRYSSLADCRRCVTAILLSSLSLLAIRPLQPEEAVTPLSVVLLDAVLALLFTGFLRMAVRRANSKHSVDQIRGIASGYFARLRRKRVLRGNTVLIVGAGDAGEMIAREMKRHRDKDYSLVGFVDDDPGKRGRSIHDIPILGEYDRIPDLVRELRVREIVVAVPSSSRREFSEILNLCKRTTARIRVVPDFNKAMEQTVRLSDLKQLQIEDILARQPADLDSSLISGYLAGRVILVTGAGGSIGSELCRQMLPYEPAEIILFGRGEYRIIKIHEELSALTEATRLGQILGDVINNRKVEEVVRRVKPDIIFHAGADKHVPLMEMNPDEAVLNNIIGTRNILTSADESGVERVVCISTDKAVNPTNIMGSCKRVAELLIQSDLCSNTIPIAVRFGNVLGSRGSVVPLFRHQIATGGPITVTHKDMRRYFMTIPEAAGLVVQAGAMGRAGDIFVLDMGEQVRIWDLAANMARLAGLIPGEDIEMKEIGLRPGEKIHEELVGPHESRRTTAHPKIFCVTGRTVDSGKLLGQIDALQELAIKMDFGGIRDALRALVPEYHRGGSESRNADDGDSISGTLLGGRFPYRVL